MLPQSQPRKKANSSKVNLTISVVFHALLVGVMIYFAAREGLLGKKIQKIAVTVEKEKPKDKPKEPDKPKVEPPKPQTPKVEPPKAEEAKAPPPQAPPVVAPANNDVASFNFDGGKAVNTESDPVQLYKGYIEYVLRSKWNRPDNMADDQYVAEVNVSVDRQGNIREDQWLQGSGNAKWDQTVKDVFAQVKTIDRRPPTNFPPNVTVRFDVQAETATEPVLLQ
jgi:type IV secretory pathway VirB10-like protein